jgi:hypothetical protein
LADLTAVAERLNVPRWWAEAVTVEYLPVRLFAADEEIWKFDFDLVTDDEVVGAITEHRIVVGGTIYHNVRDDVLSDRMLGRLVSAIPVPLTLKPSDVCPEGKIGPHNLCFRGNSIDAWDPKLAFSQHMQVRDNDGLWQWEIASFSPVPGASYGKWVSTIVDLEPLDEVRVRLAHLRNPPVRRRPGEDDYDEFRIRVQEFYLWLEAVRRPIRDALRNVHVERKTRVWQSTVVVGDPPRLSQFEDFTVRDGAMLTRLHGEALMFRMCIEHVRRAGVASAELGDLDRAIAERVEAIISAAAFLEAFINAIGSEIVPKWELYENLTIEGKWQQCLLLGGYPDRYDASREPFQTLGKIIKLRNRWLHYGREFEKVRQQGRDVVTWVDAKMGPAFVATLPDRLRDLVTDMCSALERPAPAWLNDGPGWQL